MIWGRAVSAINAQVWTPEGRARSIRFTSRVLALGEPPRRGDIVVDLEGAHVLPGLVNAHDHLELNHYGRIKFRDRYANAAEWIGDMRPRLAADDRIREARRQPLTERLFIGALKNLLAGVTTVAHHNPYYRELRRTSPVRVVRRYGWAHSFALEHEPAGVRGEPGGGVAQRWRRTPADAPFFVHLAEGVDADAAGELARLDALGCLAPNTVLVHGVAIDADGWRRVAETGAGLVWCPASNAFLFDRTASIREALDGARRPRGAGVSASEHGGRTRPRVALGSDSRLTGSRDLLDELRAAREAADVTADELLAMVTTGAASVLRLPRAGRLALGDPADLTVIPASAASPGDALAGTRRGDVRLVAIGGRPLVGDRSMAAAFRARGRSTRALCVDGRPKVADAALARRIAGCPIAEPGVVVE